MRRPPLFAPGSFAWLLGIEDTCVYPAADVGAQSGCMTELDEHRLTDHDLHWRDDLRHAAELGADAIRYGMSWPLVHLAPGEFDWAVLDERVSFAVDELGLDIVADLVHYGTPRWLNGSFADPRFPDALAEFAGALAHRYAGRIRAYTPVNEPLTTASFSGLRAVWPPYRTGWDGWVSVAVPIAAGAAAAARAIRAEDPAAIVVHVEASTSVSTSSLEHLAEAALLADVGWLPTDLILGRVTTAHPMHGWLLEHGAVSADLDALAIEPVVPDVIGVNYYPELTPRRLHHVGDRVLQVAYDGGTRRFDQVLRGFAARYGLPLIVTETSIEGDDRTRSEWLTTAVRTVQELSDEIDLRGFTWWPLLDFVDWSWAAGGENVEEFAIEVVDMHGESRIAFAPPLGRPNQGRTPFLRRMGLLRLEENANGTLERVPTKAAESFAAITGRARKPIESHVAVR